MIEARTDRVVQRCFPLRDLSEKRISKLPPVIGERDIFWQSESHRIIKMNDEYLVVRVAFADESHGRSKSLGALWCHAKAFVDQNSNCHRNVLTRECGELLRMTVFEDVKVFFLKA